MSVIERQRIETRVTKNGSKSKILSPRLLLPLTNSTSQPVGIIGMPSTHPEYVRRVPKGCVVAAVYIRDGFCEAQSTVEATSNKMDRALR